MRRNILNHLKFYPVSGEILGMVVIMKLYFIGTFEDISSDSLSYPLGMRVVGFHLDFDTAKKCVEENWADLYEDGLYKYAVIEEAEPGLYQTIHSHPIFYKWIGDSETGSYKLIDKPKEFKNIRGFTIG